ARNVISMKGLRFEATGLPPGHEAYFFAETGIEPPGIALAQTRLILSPEVYEQQCFERNRHPSTRSTMGEIELPDDVADAVWEVRRAAGARGSEEAQTSHSCGNRRNCSARCGGVDGMLTHFAIDRFCSSRESIDGPVRLRTES